MSVGRELAAVPVNLGQLAATLQHKYQSKACSGTEA